MPYKHTIFFECRTNASGEQDGSRTGGWSESYLADSKYDKLGDSFDKLLQARVGLLPTTSRVVGWRIADTTKQSSGIVRSKVINGKWDEQADFPSLSLLCRGVSASGNRLQLILRGLPDVATQEGEYSPKAGTWKRFEAFRACLPPFFQICRNLAANAADIIAINDQGSVLTRQEIVGNVVGAKIWIQRTKGELRKNVNGLYVISERTNASLFKLANWSGGACYGGRARMQGTVNASYPANMTIERVIHRKVGRPIFSFVGRR